MLTKIMMFTLPYQDVSHVNEHGEPKKVQEDQESQQKHKRRLEHVVVHGWNIMIGKDQPGFINHGPPNNEWQDDKPRQEPRNAHADEADRS